MRFLIVNSETNEIVEEHNVKHVADKHSFNLNSLEDIPIYFVQPTCPQCDSEDMYRPELEDSTWVCSNCRTTYCSEIKK